jgi:hypothetical protein
MWCYFMRGGHIAAFEELTGLSDEAATTKADALLSERKHLFEGFELWDGTRVVPSIPSPPPGVGIRTRLHVRLR